MHSYALSVLTSSSSKAGPDCLQYQGLVAWWLTSMFEVYLELELWSLLTGSPAGCSACPSRRHQMCSCHPLSCHLGAARHCMCKAGSGNMFRCKTLRVMLENNTRSPCVHLSLSLKYAVQCHYDACRVPANRHRSIALHCMLLRV